MYSVTSLKLTKLKLSLSKLTFSAKILAGVKIENANFMGVDLHATIVDIYYPDWNGDLKHVGVLKETSNDTGENVCLKKNQEDENADLMEDDDEKNDHGICLPAINSTMPFFTIQPRSTSISKSDAVTIVVNDVGAGVYLNFIKDAIISRGSMDIYVSGVAHVKSPLGIPLSLGIICDNVVNLLKFPIQIIGKSCIVGSVSTGWLGLSEMAVEVKEKAMDIFMKRSIIKNKRGNDNEEGEFEKDDEIEPFLLSSEVILDWHDF